MERNQTHRIPQVGTDTEDSEQDEGGERDEVQPPLNSPRSAVEAENSINTVERLRVPPRSVAEPLCGSRKGWQTKADDSRAKLEAHERMHREITETLEREERKLNGKRKRVGGSTTKLKKLIRDTFELNALKQFNDLRIEYHRKKARHPNLKLCPSLDASTAISRRLGKSDYYARKLRERSSYLHRVGELQVPKQGKGGAHRSLLSEPQIAAGIQDWVKGAVPVEDGGYIGRVRCSGKK